MEKIVIDSSIAVKWFVDEEGSEKAVELLKLHQVRKINLYAPESIVLEVVNGLFFKAKFSADELILVVEKLYLFDLNLLPLRQTSVLSTVKVMFKEKIASYDALFIAVAQELDCPLVTNDRKHHVKKMYRKIRYL